MGEAGEKNSQPIERAAAQRNDARPFSIQPEAPEERGKSQDENTDRKRQGYLRNAPSKLFRQRDAENAPAMAITHRLFVRISSSYESGVIEIPFFGIAL